MPMNVTLVFKFRVVHDVRITAAQRLVGLQSLYVLQAPSSYRLASAATSFARACGM